jgi:hypothetical protein
MPTITKDKIIWDRKDWLAGLHPQYTATGHYAQFGGDYAATQRCFNPFRFLGYACPGYNPTAVTNASIVLSSFIRNGFNNDKYAYLIENGAKIHRYDIINNLLLNDSAGVGFPHTIAHGAHTTIVGNDCVLYNHKVGGTSAMRYLYSFNDATDWDIGTCNMNTTTPAFDDDFMSTAPATPLGAPYLTGGKGYPHPLIVGDDDILYIGDRNYLHAYDGQNVADDDGKFIEKALIIPEGYVITSFARIRPKTLCIFAYYDSTGTGTGQAYFRGNVKCFFWNYLDLDPFDVEDLDDNIVGEAFEYQGTVGCFTSGRPTDMDNATKNSKLKIYDGDKFIDAAYFIGNVPIRGGVDIVGREIKWLESSGGKIFSYNNNFGIQPSLNIIGESQNAATASGLLKTFGSSALLASSYTDESNYYCNTVCSGYYGSALYTSSMVELDDNVEITEIRVKFLGDATGGRDFNMSIQDEFGSVVKPIISNLSTITTTNRTITIPGLTTDGKMIPSLRRFKIALTWGLGSGANQTPIVSKIEMTYKPSKY